MPAHSSAQTDFHLCVSQAGGLILEATCVARSAARRPLPHPHRRLLTSAIRHLEHAQQDLFQAREDPWRAQPKPRQLELL
jgi:hypothetical protein